MTPAEHAAIARQVVHAERSGDAAARQRAFRLVAGLPRPDADAVADHAAALEGETPPVPLGPVSPPGGAA